MRSKHYVACRSGALLVSIASVLISGAGATEPASQASAPWPDCASNVLLKAGERLADDSYRSLVLGDTLASGAPEGLFKVGADAAARGEGYKALYFARLVTSVAGNNAAAWSNRATLAEKLGLAQESETSKTNAATPNEAAAPPPSMLPGTAMAVRPASIADFAAMMSLIADDIFAAQGRPLIVAVNDHVSGIFVPTEGDVEARGHAFAQAQPLKLVDVSTNLYGLGDGSPMGKKVDVGNFAMGLLAVAGAGAALDSGMHYAVDTSYLVTSMGELAGQAFAKAANTPSKFSGGSFVTKRLDDKGQWKDEKAKPQTTGEVDAVGLPLPLLWASGSSMRATVPVEYSYTAVLSKDPVAPVLVTGAGVDTKTADVKKRVSDLKGSVPRVDTVCAGSTCWTGSAHEFMLNSEELPVLFGDSVQVSDWVQKLNSVNKQALEQAYKNAPDTISLTLGRESGSWEVQRKRVTVFDAKGACYSAKIAPDQWIVSGAPAKKKR